MTKPGAHSLAEIVSQPRCWSDSLKELEQAGLREKIGRQFGGAGEWLLVGCGSSYYLALSAAASWIAITGRRARAVPASELLLFPDSVLTGSQNLAAVVISRSGRTSEAVKAAQLLEEKKDVRTLAITCTPEQPLEQIATSAVVVLPANEESTVMTRSFTSMLLALQYVATGLVGDHTMAKGLAELPTSAERALKDLPSRIRKFVASHQVADYICLGQGPFFGLACECALKLSEMSASYAQSYHTLEFRHGPKSVVGPETLVAFLLSESGQNAESGVLQETKALGGTTLTVINQADDRVRASSDLLVELDFELPELARLAPYVVASQLMGVYTGLKKGLDPDNPRNLSRVVTLDDGESLENSEQASL
ncbi:MAG TPA: SIS domain-containing protein [Terriglobales bacterium]|nr:SIS domain-containing protein [Terriglobales bacterium]